MYKGPHIAAMAVRLTSTLLIIYACILYYYIAAIYVDSLASAEILIRLTIVPLIDPSYHALSD